MCDEAGCLKGATTNGGNGGCTNNLCTYPGLLAPSAWTDYGSGAGAGLVAINSDRAIAENLTGAWDRGECDQSRRAAGDCPPRANDKHSASINVHFRGKADIDLCVV